ncbi:MAG: PSD1 domain-containing protein [Candidatus Hydrogenedentes bacterium]|nr:PSD1 domain-containing protein [Candidatus Hydrogenedentota bacterium]
MNHAIAYVLMNLSALTAADPAALDHFESQIRPLFITHCIQCHGPEKQKGGLRLDSRAGWMNGGEKGPAIVPSEVENSLLIKAVRRIDAHLQMPPDEKLSAEEIAALEKWVASGAPDPRETSEAAPKREKADPKTFWSFQPIQDPAPPTISKPDWVQTPIDAFILATLDAKGLTPAPRADPRTLVRRAYFDLIGLPPTPEQVDAFVKDPSPEAWSKLIDELLASPQYGERWGRHWLDVARYADSGGFETDIYYKNAWRYRDYVVKSFNEDKPYDVFIKEQIAGDELWPGNLDLDGTYKIPEESLHRQEARIGTGFYTLSPQIHESNMNGKKIRYETFTDWVDTTGAAFMGLTMSCARCHDHKFDPISQQDYYGLQAVFASSKQVQESVVPPMSVADYHQHYPKILAVDEARRAVRLFDEHTKGRDLSDDEKTERQKLMIALAESVLKVQEKTAQGEPFDSLYDLPTATVLGHEEPELIPAVHVLNRGELVQPRDEVSAAVPAALRDASAWTDPVPTHYGARTALANWLTCKSHPLTSRVMVNRIWQGHFGRGIVSSVNDFGQMGARPTHPELLDWLATEFMKNGWSIKHMHRVIMKSSAYQMDSAWQNETNSATDPTNYYLWKMNRRRLEAEALWDAIHSASGTLNLKMGGRPVLPPLEKDEGAPGYWFASADPADHNRRGLYILQRRNFRFPMFDVFDLPVNAVSAPARDTTTVAPQALWLMNNSIAVKQAEAFAARLMQSPKENPNAPAPDAATLVQNAWRIALGRNPTDAERLEAITLMGTIAPTSTKDGLTQLCLAIFNMQEFAYVD